MKSACANPNSSEELINLDPKSAVTRLMSDLGIHLGKIEIPSSYSMVLICIRTFCTSGILEKIHLRTLQKI